MVVFGDVAEAVDLGVFRAEGYASYLRLGVCQRQEEGAVGVVFLDVMSLEFGGWLILVLVNGDGCLDFGA